jgi:D-proline reductase (dithiol) PrdB
LTARTLEEAGISTVVLGSALDILTRAGTPRIVFNDLPLGNPAGKPFDTAMQMHSINAALALFYTAEVGGALETLPHRWSQQDDWRHNFLEVRPDNQAQLLTLGDENRRQRSENKRLGLFRP